MDRRQWREPCDERIVAEGVQIGRGGMLRITRGRQLLMHVHAGTVWLTLEHDPRDVIAGAGRWFRIDSDGVVLATALKDARITLSAPLAAPARWRVEQMAADGRPARLHLGLRGRGHPWARAFWAVWLRLYRFGRHSIRTQLRAVPTVPGLDARTRKDIGLDGVQGSSFAERADHYRWLHDAHFELPGNGFI